MARVAGIGPGLAKAVVAARPFSKREDLKKVPRLGPKTFSNVAGFLRVPCSSEPLDATRIHPDDYAEARAALRKAGVSTKAVAVAAARGGGLGGDALEKLEALPSTPVVRSLTDGALAGDPRAALAPARGGARFSFPGRGGARFFSGSRRRRGRRVDPGSRRRDRGRLSATRRVRPAAPRIIHVASAAVPRPSGYSARGPSLLLPRGRSAASPRPAPRPQAPPLETAAPRTIGDLRPGVAVPRAPVRNVAPFGAFVDVGVGVDGLLHASAFGPGDGVALGAALDVVVASVDVGRRRIGLRLAGPDRLRKY